MKKFNCNCCSYSTDTPFCYKKHLTTQKHKEKSDGETLQFSNTAHIKTIESSNIAIKNVYKCTYCNQQMASAANLSRHDKSCLSKKNISIELQKQIIALNEKLDVQNKLLADKDATINMLKSMVNNAGSLVKSSMSTMNYVIKNYNEAPAIEYFKDYSLLHNEQDDDDFIATLVEEHKNNTLHSYIGQFIVKYYKKNNPKDQSIWNSDTNRLTYVIRELLNNNKIDWQVDKKGIKITQFIINPIIEYVEKFVRGFIDTMRINTKISSAKICENNMHKIKNANDLVKDIEDKKLADDILRYIAPHFYLAKSDELIEL